MTTYSQADLDKLLDLLNAKQAEVDYWRNIAQSKVKVFIVLHDQLP